MLVHLQIIRIHKYCIRRNLVTAETAKLVLLSCAVVRCGSVRLLRALLYRARSEHQLLKLLDRSCVLSRRHLRDRVDSFQHEFVATLVDALLFGHPATTLVLANDEQILGMLCTSASYKNSHLHYLQYEYTCTDYADYIFLQS